MNGNKGFNHNSGMFTSCFGYYDSVKKKFRRFSDSEIAECCMNNCKDSVNFCKDFCNNNYKDPKDLSLCLEKCKDQEELCTDTCRISSGVNPHNIYEECAKIYNCYENMKTKSGYLSPECIQKKKDDIKDCCYSNCIPTKDIDCQKYCDFLQDFTLKLYSKRVLKKSPLKKSTVNYSGSNTWKWILSSVIASIIVICMFLGYKKYSGK
jgi:hypothetical protein